MNKKVLFTWNRVDEILIKMKDSSGKMIYRTSVNINDTKRLAEAFIVLEKYGQNIEELFKEIREQKAKLQFWDYSRDDQNEWPI